ncbi:MAG: uroporphyrinogen decarboxylase family protein [Candidatus Hodarchaeota archaeon]
MNGRERFLTALNHDEPDRVPLYHTNEMPVFVENWMERYEDEVEEDDVVLCCGSDLTMAKMMGFDAVWSNLPRKARKEPRQSDYEGRLPELQPGQAICSEGRIHQHALLHGKGHNWYVAPALTSLDLWLEWYDDYEFEPLPSTQISGLKRSYQEAINGPNGGILPTLIVGALFETVVESLGMREFSIACRKRRSELEEAFDKVLELRLVQVNTFKEVGIDVALIGDDSAYKDRTYISPELHRELVVPRYKKIADELHRAGIKLLLHSDGFTEPYFPGFIEAGIDGIETIEKAAGMDFGHLKEKYGEQLALCGPVDCSRLLSYGTPADIEAEIITLIKQGKKGGKGGFAIGPCTALIDTIPIENAEAMVNATIKHGKYPL